MTNATYSFSSVDIEAECHAKSTTSCDSTSAWQDAFRALGGELERLGCLELRKLAKFTGLGLRVFTAFISILHGVPLASSCNMGIDLITGDSVMLDDAG